jgi:hypothetical protein
MLIAAGGVYVQTVCELIFKFAVLAVKFTAAG